MSMRSIHGSLFYRVHYDRAKAFLFFFFSSFVSLYGFFYDFDNDEAVSSPGVDWNYGKSHEFSRNCDGSFISAYVDLPFQFLRVPIVNILDVLRSLNRYSFRLKTLGKECYPGQNYVKLELERII